MDNFFNYQFLGRLESDCKYYLGFGNRSKKCLWYQDEKEHIEGMKNIYNSFEEHAKPEWITFEQILQYEKEMLQRE